MGGGAALSIDHDTAVVVRSSVRMQECAFMDGASMQISSGIHRLSKLAIVGSHRVQEPRTAAPSIVFRTECLPARWLE